MSPIKLSLFNSDDDREESVELDDELAGQFMQVVDATPDLTVADALRQGIQHVVDKNAPSQG
ncbi:MAG TPA: hypothetical protein VIH08_00595 [Blastococcus sp.]|jgi:hypothetical protein